MFKKGIFGLSKSLSLVNKYTRNFTGIRSGVISQVDYTAEPILDIFAKRFRKIILDRTILAKDKLIIPAMRERQPEDTLANLREGHLCAGVINARDEFPDLDLVFENRSIFSLRNRHDALIRSVDVKVGNELVRCTLGDIQTHYIKNWLVNVQFNRYLVGRPNLLYLPIKMNFNKKNMYINKGSDLTFKMKGIWVYSYNSDYPTCLEIDPENVTPNVGYRLGELANLLPDGIELHPQYKHRLNHYILEINETRDIQLRRTLEVMEYYRKLKLGILFEEDVKIEDEDDMDAKASPEKPKERKKFKARRKKPKSLKKIVAAMDIKVREGVTAATSKDDGKKTTKKTEA